MRPLLLFLACSCAVGPDQRLCEFTGEALGTQYTVKIVAEEGARLSQDEQRAVAEAITRRLDDVNSKMSTYAEDSELSRFNRSRETTPQRLSAETVEVFGYAQQVSEASGGAFDVTVGPLVNAWGFGPEQSSPAGPSEEGLAALRQRVGFRLIEVNPENLTVRKTRPDVYCDLSAIAKGYAVDRVAEALDALGCERYMVEVGGEVKTRGLNADGLPWQIAVEKPISERRAIHRVIGLRDAALATSGDYRNYYEKDGVRLSHTIDPRTGRPVAHRLASVTVVHDSCTLADAYATALMVLGPNDGYDLAVNLRLAAFFIVREGAGAFSEKATPAFGAHFQKPS